jgi:hypothetical protein
VLLSTASAAVVVGSLAAARDPNGAITDQKGPPIMSTITTKDDVQIFEVTNSYPGGFWKDQGYNWFSGS